MLTLHSTSVGFVNLHTAHRARLGRAGGSRWDWVLQIKIPCHTVRLDTYFRALDSKNRKTADIRSKRVAFGFFEKYIRARGQNILLFWICQSEHSAFSVAWALSPGHDAPTIAMREKKTGFRDSGDWVSQGCRPLRHFQTNQFRLYTMLAPQSLHCLHRHTAGPLHLAPLPGSNQEPVVPIISGDSSCVDRSRRILR